MRLNKQLVLASLASTSLAQTTTASASAASNTWTVTVGKGDHTFRPESLLANIGDIIEFNFFPPNHSVVRAEYNYPCIPYELTGKGKVGFFSGFKPVDQILDNPPKWQLRINDTAPIFFYCSAVGSCINYQMVGVINPNASVSLATQKEAAKNSKYMLQPGDAFPAEGGLSTSSSSSSSTSTSATAAAATTTAAPATSGHKSFPAGAIAGIVVGVIVIVVLAAGLFFFMGRSKSLKETVNRQSIAPSMASLGYNSRTGHLSPASPPPPMPNNNGPIYGPDGTMYLPVKAIDRSSLPPYAGQQSPQGDGLSSNGSPGPGHVAVGHYDLGTTPQTQPQRGGTVRGTTQSPAEMFAGGPEKTNL